MRVLFASMPAQSHIAPMLPLACAAHQDGHDVVFATGPDAVALLRGAGLEVLSAGLRFAEVRRRYAKASGSELAGLSPQERLEHLLRHGLIGIAAPAMAEDLLPLSDQFAECEGEQGFLIEAVGAAPALQALSLPWEDGHKHKELLARTFKHLAPFISVARDHGEGEVVLDEHGRALTRWSLRDEVDARMFRRAMVELAKLQRAAGAKEILTLYQQPLIWREGDDFDEFLAAIEQGSLEANDVAVFSAHQMGSCRMGSDPTDSVADGRGELHDTEGVWIGDGSAFPTAPGVNPMISIMSLAHRTAANMLAAS